MARASRSSSLALLSLGALLLLASQTALPFVGTTRGSQESRVARASEAGKVNVKEDTPSALEEEIGTVVPVPIVECDTACLVAIEECLEDGCSVEALAKLDAILASDEKSMSETIQEIKHKVKALAANDDDKTTAAWFSGSLRRIGSLRAQLHAVKEVDDTDFIQKWMKAASLAFGGGRHGDYPKVGVSPYTV